MGIIAMALTKNDNPNALADPVHPNFAKIIVMLAVLTIGPLFAIPRTGAVSYDVGIRPLSLKTTIPQVWLFIRFSFSS